MIFPFNCTPCLLCWPSSSSSSSSTSSSSIKPRSTSLNPQQITSDADERTPLISSSPQITPSPQLPPINTAQQQADETEANKIVSQTIRCLVDVYSQAPFSHLRVRPTTPPTSENQLAHSPAGSSTWRAYDPPTCQPISAKARKLSLGFDPPPLSNYQAISSTSSYRQQQIIGHKKSFHSLKTIVNPHQHDSSSPPQAEILRPASAIEQPSHPTAGEALQASRPSLDEPECGRLHSRKNSSAAITSSSTQFDTIRTFQTARDHPNPLVDAISPSESLNLPPVGSPAELDDQPSRPPSPHKPQFVHDLWNPDHGDSTPHQTAKADGNHQETDEADDSDYLTDDPDRLTNLIANGFRLKDPGPILVEL